MAETPPPFQAAPPPQARATNSANRACLIIVLLVLGLCGIGVVIFGVFVKGVWNQVSSTAGCMATFELAHDAAIAYSKEHGGKLPNSATWQDDIRPYYDRLRKKMADELEDAKMLQGFLPPASGNVLECKWEGRVTGVAFNPAVSGKKVSDIKDATTTVMLFETNTSGMNLTMPYKPMPKATAPKIMYNEREWIVYYIEGNKDPFDSSTSGAKTIHISPDDALTPGGEKAKGPKSGSETTEE